MLAGVAIDDGGTGIAHAIGHALGTLGHVPHGVAVAVGLARRAGVEHRRRRRRLRAGGDSARLLARRRAVARSTSCSTAAGSPTVVRRVGPLAIDVDELAPTMIADENRPMYDNNCRLAGDDDRRHAGRVDAAVVVGVVGVSAIARIEITHHRLPLDPPFPASWDPQPRTRVPGDDRARRRRRRARRASARATRCTGSPTTSAWFIGEDPLDLDRHARRARQHRLPRRPAVAARRRPVGPRRADPRPARCGTWSAGGRRRCAPTPRRACTVRSTRWARWPARASSSASRR